MCRRPSYLISKIKAKGNFTYILQIQVLPNVVRNLKAKETLGLCKRLFVVSPIKLLSLLSNIMCIKYVTFCLEPVGSTDVRLPLDVS